MREIGHHPGTAESVEGWRFRRCRCGFVLALSETGRVWWVRANSSVVEISSPDVLFAALSTDCRYYRGPARLTGTRVVEVEEKASIATARPRLKAPQSGAPRVAIETKPRVVVKPRRSGARTSDS
jgi:hypothetical protein